MITSGAHPLALLAALVAGLIQAPALAEDAPTGRTAAVFPTELDDPTLPYGRKPPPIMLKRLDLATAEMRRMLGEKGLTGVSLDPQAEEIRKQAPLYKCNGCAADIAKALGAAYAVTLIAERGSQQIHNLRVTIQDAASGRVVRIGGVVISANTDDDWAHAVRSVVKNKLLAEPLPDRS